MTDNNNNVLFFREAELKRHQANIKARLAKSGIHADTESDEESEEVSGNI